MAAIPTYDFVWQQGEDGTINLVYRRDGATVNLTGYKLRMDVRSEVGAALFTFNSDDIVEVPSVDATGATDNEAVLGADGSIKIVVPRSTSLNDGAFVPSIGKALPYDIFLRDTNNKQRKIMKGTITIESSQTRWN